MSNAALKDPFPHLCSICGKPVDLKTCKTDADGRTVHSECINGKVIEISRKQARKDRLK
jgi:hypothetical protein